MPNVNPSTGNSEGQDKSQLLAVLQVLKKYNLKGTEEQLKREANLTEDGALQQDSDVSSVLTGYKVSW